MKAQFNDFLNTNHSTVPNRPVYTGRVYMPTSLLFPTIWAVVRHAPCAALRRGNVARVTTARMLHARIVVARQNTPTEALRDLANVDAAFSTRVVTCASVEHTRLVLSVTASWSRLPNLTPNLKDRNQHVRKSFIPHSGGVRIPTRRTRAG